MPANRAASEPTDDALERDLAFAILAARMAGERAMSLRAEERWEGRTLGDIGDQACDGFLRGLLLGRRPADGVLSEETIDHPDRLEKARAWIVDPLDGTREFGQAREDWAVHVALCIGGLPVLGAVALPAQERLLYGICLPGRERAGLEGRGALSKGSDEGSDPPRIACSRSHTPEWMERFHAELGGGELIRSGSVGNKVGLLLLGEADVYVHRKGLKEWDTCAPEVIARALGWTVCKLRGEEHRYNQRDPVNHEFVACRPAARERVLAALERCGALD